jgi:hypothetical protein
MAESRRISVSGVYSMKALTLLACLCGGTAFAADHGGVYKIRVDQPQQVIKGLGFEIQSDSIGSGNDGMPDEVVAVPHGLTATEKVRFYQEMLHGFRYARLAMGLYLRGNDAEKKHIVERYPGQMDDLRSMQQVSGIEGFDVEYWSPAWFWLHALKPVTNLEAAGSSLGYWRPAGTLQKNLRPNLRPGHWEFNPQNWNAIAGFLKYLPWDSTRLTVEESTVEHDQRILVWRSKEGKLGIALSNRGVSPYTFHLAGAGAKALVGHRYTIAAFNVALGHKSGQELDITVPPQSFEFWTAR